MTISAPQAPDVSVVVATYNRCEVVRGAVESLMNQDSRGTSYEVIVVDNNSTDATRRALEDLCGKYENLFYHFEEKQGVSYARNRGIAAARAPILAFTDDDIKPASDWVASISDAFRRFPEADCIGGKVLPQTASEFPRWLTSKHWTPLALLDMGDEPIVLDVLNGPGLVAANLAVRAAVFKEVGLFQPELQRVKNFIGSLEDHQFEMQLGAANKRLMYVPELVVYAQVLDERLHKAYHRRWYRGHGYFYALMRNENFESSKARLFDVPSHLYRRTGANIVDWVRYRVERNEELQLQQELELEFFWGFFRKRFADLFK